MLSPTNLRSCWSRRATGEYVPSFTNCSFTASLLSQQTAGNRRLQRQTAANCCRIKQADSLPFARHSGAALLSDGNCISDTLLDVLDRPQSAACCAPSHRKQSSDVKRTSLRREGARLCLEEHYPLGTARANLARSSIRNSGNGSVQKQQTPEGTSTDRTLAHLWPGGLTASATPSAYVLGRCPRSGKDD